MDIRGWPFLFQPLRPTLMGTQAVLAFLLPGPGYLSLSQRTKRLALPTTTDCRAVSFAQVAAPEDFPRSSSSTSFANPEDLFSINWILVSPVDFRIGFFRSSNRVVKFFEGVRRNDFWRQARRLLLGQPRGPFLVRRSWFAGRLSCLTLFQEARTGSSSFLRA